MKGAVSSIDIVEKNNNNTAIFSQHFVLLHLPSCYA